MSDALTPANKRATKLMKIGLWCSTLGIVVFITTFFYGYFQLAKVNIALANMMSRLETENIKAQESVRGLTLRLQSLQQSQTKLTDQLAAQAQAMQQLTADVKGDVNHWHVLEAQYLVKQANEQARFSADPTISVALLQQAADVLKQSREQAVISLRQAILDAIPSLQSQPHLNTAEIYTQLIAIDQLIDQLHLPTSPLATNGPSNQVVDINLPWWKRGLQHSANLLQKIIVVKRSDNPNLPIVMPDEKNFLYQNLHAQIETLIWALLHREPLIFQRSIQRALTWIQTYFVQDQTETKQTIAKLMALQNIQFTHPKPDFSALLMSFERYFNPAPAQSATQTEE